MHMNHELQQTYSIEVPRRFGAFVALSLLLLTACSKEPPVEASLDAAAAPPEVSRSNPYFAELNQAIDYAQVTAGDVIDYADTVLEQVSSQAEAIRVEENPTFDNVMGAIDDIYRDVTTAANNSWLMYWVSTDAATRDAGLASYKKLDTWRVALYSDKQIFKQVVAVSEAENLTGPAATLVDGLIRDMRHTGVDLEPDALARFLALTEENNDLSSRYSTNMNSDASVLTIDELGAIGLPDNFKTRYATSEGVYEIPVIAANRGPVLNNAGDENTRRDFITLYRSRAANENLPILDKLVANRYEIGRIMGHDSFAGYQLENNMAQSSQKVWDFLNDLTERTAAKASDDLARLKQFRSDNGGAAADKELHPWDVNYYRNQILKTEYGVDQEKIREYLPLSKALTGMMDFYQGLLGLEFRAVESPSVWHEEVEAYEVYEAGELTGRFYLDLFPRPNKESWFYGVSLTPGSARSEGYEVPVAMMLGNFTRPSGELPSLISHSELSTLFHEFGHIMNNMSYAGQYALQSNTLADFAEAMSSIFENWIWDYDVLKSFAEHYESGEVLPEETFQKMLAAKSVNSGLSAQRTVEFSVYDMMLYDRYDPENPMPTDDIWPYIGEQFVQPSYIEGTHAQASWIHVNTHPVYMYGYLWSDVYAQDMFTQFEENGLKDTATGVRYRKLILANGTQKPIEPVVEEFLGRPSNNEAYVRSLGLE